MADVLLGLAVAQVVVPVAVATIPEVWTQIVRVLKRMPRISLKYHLDSHSNTNLQCILSILNSLELMGDDRAWTKTSHNCSLLNNLKLKAESVEDMIKNDNRIMGVLHKRKIAKTIQSIALMMQLLELNIRVTREASTSIESHRSLDLAFYQKSRENLRKDLLVILDKDDLVPVVNPASMERSGTYPRIVYEFELRDSRTSLGISRGVRECLEALLRWLRDLKLLQDTIDRGCSSLLGVALFELFSDVLPTVLLQHLRRPSKLNTQVTAKQFYSNVCFLRSFSSSSTFKAIQGEDGLQLEDEDKIAVDLRDDGWVTWSDVEQECFITFGSKNRPSSALEVAGPSSRGGALTTSSGNMDAFECPICHVFITGISPRKQHFEACFKKEQRLNDYNAIYQRCPVCRATIHHLSFDEMESHTNACLDARGDL